MAHAHRKPRRAIRPMDIPSVKQKLQVLLSLVLLAHLIRDTEAGPSCCTRIPRPCFLYELLCRPGPRNNTVSAPGKTSRFTIDASAGILMLGKRKENESRYHDRLQQLLQSSRNQAKGILTVGKRTEEQPLRYLMQPVDRDFYR